MKRAVTINDIAAQLNLSRNTVAKVLNGHYVPETTRELVLKKAREMNYKSLNSEILKPGRKKYRILLISGKPLININYFIPIIKGIENFCFENDYELFQYTHNSAMHPFKEVEDYITELNADGIAALEYFDKNSISKLLSLDKPVCFNDFSASDLITDKKFDLIRANDEQSVRRIVKLLYSRYQITRFTFVGDSKHCLSFHGRYLGMLSGIFSFNGTHSAKDDILCSDLTFDYGSPSAVKTEILKLKYRPQCFVCCNDFVARTVCNALKSLGLKVPQDAFVTGFDNVWEATAFSPAITSFSVEKEFLGREAMRTLIHRIEHPDTPARNITVSATLVERESTIKT